MVLVQYVVNSGLAAVYEALKGNQPVVQTWSKHYLWTSITYVAGASAAGIGVILIDSIGFYSALIITPIIGIIYFTYQTYLKHVQTAEEQTEQAQRHVEELNHYIAEQERIREQYSQIEKLSAWESWLRASHTTSTILSHYSRPGAVMAMVPQTPKLIAA